ncbi:hypothetical protein [Arsukibacterium sp.]
MANQNDQSGRPAMDEEKHHSGANKDQKNQQKPDQQKPGSGPGQNKKPGQ